MNNRKKHLLFLLPEYYKIPIGGYKVVFEYANRLIKDGHDVTLVYPYFLLFWQCSLKRKIKLLFKFLKLLVIKNKEISWFKLDSRICVKFCFTLSEKYIPEADYYIATANETSYYLNEYKCVDNAKKYYLIQALEDWQRDRSKVFETWKFELKKIVVSKWLLSVASEIGEIKRSFSRKRSR